jgi:hypothetical protein
VIRNAFEKAAERCERSADFFELNRMLGIARSAQLFGMPELVADADEKLERCTSFELVFESTTSQDIRLKDFMSGSARHRVRATVPLTFDWKTGRLSGKAPLENLESTMKNFRSFALNCVSNSTGERANGTFTVFDGAVNLDRLHDSTKSKAAPHVVLFVDPGRPKVGVATRCAGMTLPARVDDAPYPWSDFHRKEEVRGDLQDRFQAAEIWEITDWEAGRPGIIARKVYDRAWDTPGTHHVERSVLELRRPLAPSR